MSRKPPNVILIMTDQQRADTIGALGGWAVTPTLDRLVREGVAFRNCFCTSPSCLPSRASFFNVRWPHRLGVWGNKTPWNRSWVSGLREQGFHCVNIGKLHTVPLDAPCGFDQRFVVENKDRPLRLDGPHGGFYDEWDKFLANSGQAKPSRDYYRREHPNYDTALGAYEWPLEEKYHPDLFVGRMAEWFLRERRSESPLFLALGFPGPHPPYDPPRRWLDAYRDVDIPVPSVSRQELELQPPTQAAYRREMIRGNHDGVRWREQPTPEQLLRLRRHYAANVSLIDECVGRVLAVLEERGYLEDAVVMFASDHGDCLGDHGHIQKWTMYDEATRVPMVLWSPSRLPSGKQVDGLVQHMDVVPTIFEAAGLEPPRPSDALGATFGSTGRDVVFAQHPDDNILKGVGMMTMVRTADAKLVDYHDRDFGELYDLRNDPHELRNLWHDPARAAVRTGLEQRLAEWRTGETR